MNNTKWVLEPVHSEVQFKVRHMMINTVTGHFKKFDSTLETDGDDLTNAKVHFSVNVDSISTNNDQRDGHLKSPDFFDAANHPEMIIDGQGLEKTGEHTYNFHGNLTIRSVTKPITLHVEHGGIMKDPWGNIRNGFSVEGKINRHDFGLSWSALTETGGLVVGDEVKLVANLEYVKQA